MCCGRAASLQLDKFAGIMMLFDGIRNVLQCRSFFIIGMICFADIHKIQEFPQLTSKSFFKGFFYLTQSGNSNDSRVVKAEHLSVLTSAQIMVLFLNLTFYFTVRLKHVERDLTKPNKQYSRIFKSEEQCLSKYLNTFSPGSSLSFFFAISSMSLLGAAAVLQLTVYDYHTLPFHVSGM